MKTKRMIPGPTPKQIPVQRPNDVKTQVQEALQRVDNLLASVRNPALNRIEQIQITQDLQLIQQRVQLSFELEEKKDERTDIKPTV